MKRNLVRIALTTLGSISLFFFLFSCNEPKKGNSNSTPSPAPTRALTPVDCNAAGTDDKKILDAIYEAIKTDASLALIQWQFNVTVSNKTVTVIGWAKERDNVEDAIRQAAKNCTLVTNDFQTDALPTTHANYRATGCTPPLRPCGDICISNADTCHGNPPIAIIPPNANSPSNSNTPANNANTNVNGNVNR